MDSHESPLERVIREARERGAFDNLPGKGHPLHWEDERLVPEEQRLSNHLLKENHLLPEWLAFIHDLDVEHEALLDRWQKARIRHSSEQLSDEALRAEARAIIEKIQALNHKLLEYNLRAPSIALQRNLYPIDDDLKEMGG
jgi:hypothetical protein